MHVTRLGSGRARPCVLAMLVWSSACTAHHPLCAPLKRRLVCASTRHRLLAPQNVTPSSMQRAAATLVLEQMRARVIDLLLGSSQDHHPGTCQVPRHRLDDVPGDVLAHRHACSHALQPDCWLRAPCRRKLSATASQLVFDACNAAWLGGGVLATRSSPSTHSTVCAPRRCYMLLAGRPGRRQTAREGRPQLMRLRG